MMRTLFLKIAEPRYIRLTQFGIYLGMLAAGISVLVNPPASFQGVIGQPLVYIFGGFLFGGALTGAIAVLPGIWWLERVGIVSLITGMSIYVVVVITLGSSFLGMIVSLTLALTFFQRWLEIRRFQLAPKVEA